jgi:hypothetical protein
MTEVVACVRRILKHSSRLVLLPLCLALAAFAPAAPSFLGTAAWKQDFEQLKREMASHYANLQWAVERRGLNLPKLSAETSARLDAAKTDSEARAAIGSFLSVFGDGHLEVRWPQVEPAIASPAPPASMFAACADYRPGRRAPGLDWSAFPAFEPVDSAASAYFPAAVVAVSGHGRLGVLRIDLFDEHRFPELCEAAARGLGLSPKAACDEACAGPVERETANLLTRRLEQQIEALKRRHIHALLVDITNNGGGSNWVAVAARSVTAKHLLEPRQGFIRHDHWVRQLSSRLRDLEADLPRVDARDRPLLEQARMQYRIALAEARKPCPREAMWIGQKPGCSLVSTAGPLYAAGVLRYAAPGSLPRNLTCCYLFGPQRYRYREGVWAGPLLVLVDGGTASAAEYFAALLQDNRAAAIVGMPTYGAGCGYTDGGIETRLVHSGGQVRMPDCVRFRADGTNEVQGVTPDLAVPWLENDSPAERSRRLQKVLPQALTKVGASRG